MGFKETLLKLAPVLKGTYMFPEGEKKEEKPKMTPLSELFPEEALSASVDLGIPPTPTPQVGEVTPLPAETKEMTADLLQESRDMRTPAELAPDTGTVKDLTADYTPENAAAFFKEQAEAYKKELEEAKKTREETAEEKKTWWEGLTSREAKLEEERERWGLPGTFEQIKTLQTEAGTIRENIISLEQQRDARKMATEGKAMSMVAIQGEQALIDRAYNSRIAAEASRLSAKGAMISSLQGNMNMARQLAAETVSAMVYDQEREYRMLQDTYNMNQDLIKELGVDYDNAFKSAVSAAETKYKETKSEKEDIMKLQISAATNYGVQLDLTGMTIEEATKSYNETISPLAKEERELTLTRQRQLISGGVAGVTTATVTFTSPTGEKESVNLATVSGLERYRELGGDRVAARLQLDKTDYSSGAVDELLDKVYGLTPTSASGQQIELKKTLVQLAKREGIWREDAETVILEAGFTPDDKVWDEHLNLFKKKRIWHKSWWE